MTATRRAVLAVTSAALVAATGVASASPAQADTDWGSSDLSGSQWYLNAVGAPQAWSVSRGAGVTVAVVDTGVDTTHPDLAGRVAPQAIVAYTQQLKAMPATQVVDLEGHGTAVASVIAANADGTGITGIAPEATILNVKLSNGSFQEDAINPRRALYESIKSAADAGAKVVNLSFGATVGDRKFDAAQACQAIQDLGGLDLVIVAAAGNEGEDGNEPNAPAVCPGVVAVAAVDPQDNPASFSNYGSNVTLAAPGTRILAAAPWYSRRYAYVDGTSLAAPVVAGVAALVRAAHPELTAGQVVDLLRRTARDAYAPGYDQATGSGVVDAAAAVGLPPSRAGAHDLNVRISGSVVHWRPPRAVVTGYLVQAFRSGSLQPVASSQLEASAVDWKASPSLETGSWVEVTALLADGSSVKQAEAVRRHSADQDWYLPGEAVENLHVRRTGKRCVTLSWQNTPQALALRWVVWLEGMRTNGAVVSSGAATLEEDGSLPSRQKVCLREGDPASDMQVSLLSVTASTRMQASKRTLPATMPVTWVQHGKQLTAYVTPYWFERTAQEGQTVKVKVTGHGKSRIVAVKARHVAGEFTGDSSYYVLQVPADGSDRIEILGMPRT